MIPVQYCSTIEACTTTGRLDSEALQCIPVLFLELAMIRGVTKIHHNIFFDKIDRFTFFTKLFRWKPNIKFPLNEHSM
jgi:hypothetical protein